MRLEDFVHVNPSVSLEKGKEYPCVMMDEVVPHRRYVYGSEINEYTGGGARFQAGDTLFARITPSLENGKIAQFVGQKGNLGFGSTEFIVFRAREGISDPDFVFYLAKTDVVRKPAEKSMFGASGRQRADVNVVKEIEVPCPPLTTQQKIAGLLSPYDDLIENNTLRIQILEEMAQAIYREWFVEFRFPGHEDVPLIDSGTKLGKIPEGWEVQPFSKFVSIKPKLIVDKHMKKPYVGMNALSTNSMLIDLGLIEVKTGSSGSKFQNRDVLFPRITPSVENGKAGFVQFLGDSQIAIGSTEIIVFREKELNAEYIYFLSREHDFRGNAIKSMVGASGRQRVQPGCFDTFLVHKPPKEMLEKFAQIAAPMFEIVHTLAKKNANLRMTRDLLLPRLVRGEVDVSELEIQ